MGHKRNHSIHHLAKCETFQASSLAAQNVRTIGRSNVTKPFMLRHHPHIRYIFFFFRGKFVISTALFSAIVQFAVMFFSLMREINGSDFVMASPTLEGSKILWVFMAHTVDSFAIRHYLRFSFLCLFWQPNPHRLKGISFTENYYAFKKFLTHKRRKAFESWKFSESENVN